MKQWCFALYNCSVDTADEFCTSNMSEMLVSRRRHGYLSAASLDQLSTRLVDVQSAPLVVETSEVPLRHRGGSDKCPWTVSVEEGQRINLSVIVLPVRISLTSRRDAFVDVDDDVITRSVLFPVSWLLDCISICLSRPRPTIYKQHEFYLDRLNIRLYLWCWKCCLIAG